MKHFSLAALLVGVALVDDVQAEPQTPELAWAERASVSSPPNRNNHAMAYDASRSRVVLFGGWPNRSDTWEWDGSSWLQRAPSTVPSGRYAHAMAFDEARQRVVLFGGLTGSVPRSDTWEWDGNDWVLLSPANSPSPRYHHRMAFDAVRQKVVLFGGRDTPASAPQLGDTWEWDGSNWTQLTPAVSPPARSVHQMVCDPVRGVIVLFGGQDGVAFYSDTWEWTGGNWSPRLSSSFPAARQAHSMAFDADRQRVVLFGGAGASGYLSDSWEWDGNAWHPLAPLVSPPARWLSWMADGGAGEMAVTMFGGHDGQDMGDTWSLGRAASYLSFGTGCLGPNGLVPALSSVSGSAPRIGTTSHLRCENLPLTPTVPIFVLGFSNSYAVGPGGGYPLPQDLAPLGWPGCPQLVTLDDTAFAITTNGSVDYTIAVPPYAFLVGVQFHIQALVLYTPTGVAVTNGITGTAGW